MSMQEFWDDTAKDGTWAGYYDSSADVDFRSYNFSTRRDAVLRLLEEDGTFDRILDVGCGTGDYAEVAARHNGSFWGIDYAPEMVRQASERIPGHGERNLFVCGSGDELPYQDNTFDLVMAMGYIEYFERPDEPISEIVRVLKPGGTLVIQSFKRELCGRLDTHVIKPIKKLLGRKIGGPKLPPTWVNNKYSRGQLDGLLRPHGFKVTGYRYNNFHVVPPFLMVRVPRFYVRMSERINQCCPNLFGFLAVNYIAKYVLDKAPAPASGVPQGAKC